MGGSTGLEAAQHLLPVKYIRLIIKSSVVAKDSTFCPGLRSLVPLPINTAGSQQ